MMGALVGDFRSVKEVRGGQRCWCKSLLRAFEPVEKMVFTVGFGFLAIAAALFISRCNGEPQCQEDIEWAKKSAEPLADLSVILYRAISNGNAQTNVVFSPVSIAFALSMLEAGSFTETRNQFRYVLVKRGSSDSDTGNIYEALMHHLKREPDDKAKLHIVNGLYHQPRINLKEEYLDQVKPCFQSAVESCDFQADANACRERINNWVSENTAQKIPELFRGGSINQNTVAVLANAVYFKALWKYGFAKDKTEIGEFYRFGNADDEQKVQFLVNQHQYLYSQNNGMSILGMPYKGGEFVMYIVLPKKLEGLVDLETQLAGAELLFLFNRTKHQEVLVKIPKFNITTNVDLKPVLKSLGLNDMFSDGANFSRMSDTRFTVDAAAHETYITVDESGTEAAGSKTFAMKSLSAPQPPIPFVINRPFLYAIVHQPTHAIIFAGKVLYIEE